MRSYTVHALLVIALAALQTGTAAAISIDFVPSGATFQVGDTFDIDVVVSGLPADQVVSAYDLDIGYDDSLLSFSSLDFGTDLGTPPLGLATPLPGGLLNVFQVSLLFDFELLALQGPSVTLFTIAFEALAPGTSALTFNAGTDDIKGVESNEPFIPTILDVDASSGSVAIIEAVPEPTTLGLMALALLACMGRRQHGVN